MAVSPNRKHVDWKHVEHGSPAWAIGWQYTAVQHLEQEWSIPSVFHKINTVLNCPRISTKDGGVDYGISDNKPMKDDEEELGSVDAEDKVWLELHVSPTNTDSQFTTVQ